jgi:hypothetical protein
MRWGQPVVTGVIYLRLTVAGDGDFARQDHYPGIEFVGVIRVQVVRGKAGVHHLIAFAAQVGVEFDRRHQ